MLSKPGKIFSMYTVLECSGRAYIKAMMPTNMTKGFLVTGIYPFNN